jgi:hypothetical protein
MTKLSINVTKIDKSHLIEGKSGKYLELILNENKNGPDQYGNEGFVTQGVSKAAREAGQRGPIVGNYKTVGAKQKPTASANPQPIPFDKLDNHDDVPF